MQKLFCYNLGKLKTSLADRTNFIYIYYSKTILISLKIIYCFRKAKIKCGASYDHQ